MLTAEETAILELAERYEARRAGLSWTYTQLHMSPVRFVDTLLKLIERPDVESDPRWTMLAHRVTRVAEGRQRARGGRTFVRVS